MRTVHRAPQGSGVAIAGGPHYAGGMAQAGDEPPWHALSVEEVRERCASPLGGLSTEEAARRLTAHGPNRLPAAKGRGPLRRLIAQFDNVLIYVLLAAGVITVLLGHVVDAGVIFGVVAINAAIGYVQEGKAEQALAAIQAMIAPRCSVLRDGQRFTIDAADVVPGDVVLLEAGDRVPADLRLTRARNLRIDEALLTGESVAAEKDTERVAPHAPLAERTGMAYSGTLAVAGQGQGIAVATGAATEIGRISGMLQALEPQTTPLVRQMNRFGQRLTAVILAVSAITFAWAVWLGGYPLDDAFLIVVGLAVAAIPEGLPAVMTITLAVGVRRMAARNAIIRRLPAVETLGSVSIICTDKTGTLTRNEMTVRTAFTQAGGLDVTGVGYEPHGAIRSGDVPVTAASDPVLDALARAAVLCNDAALRHVEGRWVVDGDPMEGALLSFAVKAGLDPHAERQAFSRLDEVPFDAHYRLMATLNDAGPGAIVHVKGAPEAVIARCRAQLGPNGPAPLDHAAVTALAEGLAAEGQRVLALAADLAPSRRDMVDLDDLDGSLVLLGIVGLIDPPREEAIAAVAACRSAGITVKMITGDHAETARTIGRQLALADNLTVTSGADIDALDDMEALRHIARETEIFARTSPEHKLRIVEALQADGAIVAMTGDGVNDAPALKRADVGVAMGLKGTEAAKEAAEMVLADDNFASIVAAVHEGRTVYDNLNKVIGWTLPTNGGEAMTIIAAVAFGLTLPVTAVQILWINMVTATTLGLALAFEPPEEGVMRRAPRPPNAPLLSPFLVWRVAFVSLLAVIGAFGMFYLALAQGRDVETARTIVVNTIVVIEIVYLFSVRYLDRPSLTWGGIFGTPAVVIAVAVVTLAQFAFTFLPALQAVFATRPVPLADGLAVVGVGVLLFVVLELEKLARRRLGLGERR